MFESERLAPRLTAMFESPTGVPVFMAISRGRGLPTALPVLKPVIFFGLADGPLFIEAHSRFSSVLDRFSVFSIRWNSDALVSLV